MKFLTGLIVGALLTLFAASVIDYEWQPPTRLAVAAPAVSEPEPIRSVTIAPLPALFEPETELEPKPAPEPEPEPDPKPKVASASKTAPALLDAPEPPSASTDAVVATAVIWKPFHSEVSATGFARRLSTQLGYPFRALREGPARYHVVFDYDTEQQRQLLLSQVVALTGFEAI